MSAVERGLAPSQQDQEGGDEVVAAKAEPVVATTEEVPASEAAAEDSDKPQVLPDLSGLKVADAQDEDDDGPVKLFVGGLAWETTEESLHKVFESYGTIVEVSVMRHPRTLCSRGFGFVTLSNRKEAELACNDKHTIDGRVVEAKISAAPGEGGQATSNSQVGARRKVFVGGLSAETTDEDFRKYFEQFGEISESQILQDHMTGRSRGFGFITFTSEETYDKVFEKSRFHELKGKLVEVKSATPRQQNKGGLHGKGGRGGKSVGRGGGMGLRNRGGGGGMVMRNMPPPQNMNPYTYPPQMNPYSYPMHGFFPQVMPGPGGMPLDTYPTVLAPPNLQQGAPAAIAGGNMYSVYASAAQMPRVVPPPGPAYQQPNHYEQPVPPGPIQQQHQQQQPMQMHQPQLMQQMQQAGQQHLPDSINNV